MERLPATPETNAAIAELVRHRWRRASAPRLDYFWSTVK